MPSEIANQNNVAMRVDNPRSMSVIGCQAHDRLAALARAYIGCGEPSDFVLDRHNYFPNTGTPITAGWNA